jgi:hypothetical protein
LSASAALAAWERDEVWVHKRDTISRTFGNGHELRELRRESFAWKGGVLDLDPGENGGLALDGWDKDSISLVSRIQTYGPSDEAARELATKLRVARSGGTVRTEGPPQERRSHWAITFHLMVPRGTRIKGHVIIGPVEMSDIRGTVDLEGQNGPLSLEGVGGDVHARMENGPVNVELDGERWEGKGLDVSTQNGPVNVTVPRGYSAQLVTGTINGPRIMKLEGVGFSRSNRWNTFTLGRGGATVKVVTTNGPAMVRYGRKPI